MADQQDLSVPKAEAGLAFRLEMWASNAILGYWWVLVAAVAVILAGVAIYGFVESSMTNAQVEASTQTARIMAELEAKVLDQDSISELEKMPGQDGSMVRVRQIVVTPTWSGIEAPTRTMIPFGAALEQFAEEDVDAPAVLTEAGDALLAVHGANSGAAAHHAALLGAELYRLAGDAEAEGKALEAARGASAPAQRYAAEARLAWRSVEAGDVDAAAGVLRLWIKKENGWFGQQAAFDLGRVYQASDRAGDAEAAYRELLNTWPATPLRELTETRLEEMGVDVVPMEEPVEIPMDGAPTDGAPTEGAPVDDGSPDEGGAPE